MSQSSIDQSRNLSSSEIDAIAITEEESTEETVFNFEWTGQIAGFSADGQFSYNEDGSIEDGIVREEDLTSFDISFYDPEGNLLKTYEDNHLTFPEFNFAFDTETNEILQDGVYFGPTGLNVGEKTAVGDGEFTGLNLWSIPPENPQGELPPPHLHFDDWSDEFNFPSGFRDREDVAFFTRDNEELFETGGVGETYVDEVKDNPDEEGERIEVIPVEESESQIEPIFGSLDGDVIEVSGSPKGLAPNVASDRLIFAGDGNDLVDASIGNGSNRIYAGSGDDTLILGESDRALGAGGADRFFVTNGGNNTMTGGEGADQFWVATAEIPEAANIITDFTRGEDVIGIAGLGIGYSDLTITSQGNDALISANNSDLGIIQNVEANSLSESDFAFV